MKKKDFGYWAYHYFTLGFIMGLISVITGVAINNTFL